MLTTMTESGKHGSRPMALQEVEFDCDLWFFCYDDSAKAVQIRSQPEVSVSFANDKQSQDLTIGDSGRRTRLSAGRTAVGRPAEDLVP